MFLGLHSQKNSKFLFLGYYTCEDGYCIEIYDLKCERRCDSKDFQMNEKNSVIFQGEKIIIADCTARSTADVSRLNSVISKVILKSELHKEIDSLY